MYSQKDEEKYIRQAFEVSGRRKTFLDIGAFDAFALSNTRALFEAGCWDGVMVEPSPKPAEKIRRAYAHDRNIVVIEAAIVLEPCPTVEMYVTEDGLSTTEEANYQKWKEVGQFEPGRVRVRTITLEQIYHRYKYFDFVSIDTEGTSTDILHRLLTLSEPRCICVEHDERTTEILAVTTAKGYHCVYATGDNLVLVKNGL